MPLIPPPPIPETVPLPAMSPQAAGAGWGAIESAAGQTERLALYAGNVAAKIQAAQDQTLAQKAENQIEDDIFGAVESYRDRSDYYEFPPDAEKTAQELRKKYEAQYGKNPRVWNAIEGFLDGKIRSFQRTVEIKRLDLLTQDAKAQLLIKRDNAQREITQAATPEEKEIKRNEYFGALLAAKSVGTISPIEEVQLRDTFDLDTERAEVVAGLKSTDPRVVVRTLDRIDKGEFKTLAARDPDGLASYKATGERWLDSLNDKLQRKFDEESVNAVIGDLVQTYTSPDGVLDAVAAQKRLLNPEYQKQMGLVDANGNPQRLRISESISFLNSLEIQQKKAQDKAAEDYDAKATDLYLKGDYLGAKKMLTNPDKPKDPRRWEALSNAIDRKLKRPDEDISRHEDAAEYLRINQQMDMNLPPNILRYEIVNSEHLTTTTQKRLLDRLDSQLEKEEKAGLSRADDLLKNNIAPSKGAFMPTIPEEQIRASDAQQELDNWIKSQKVLVAAGKRQPISSDEVYQKAKEISPRYEMPFDQKIDAWKNKMQPSHEVKAPVAHPLAGQPAGRYLVNGKEVKWDGTKEIQ